MKNLPRGLYHDPDRDRYRISFTSRHTRPGTRYTERLAQGTSRRQAETYLAKLQEDDRFLRLAWPNDKKSAEELPKSWAFGEFARDIYLPHCEARNAASTIARKEQELAVIAPWFWDLPIESINRVHVAQFASERKAEGVRSRTVNIGIEQVRHVLAVAHELGFLPHPPSKFQKLPERDKRPVRWLTEQEATQSLQAAADKGHIWYAVVLFLLHTGARYSEARNLLWADVDLQGAIVVFRGTKSGQERTVPLLPEVIQALRLVERLGDYVFMYWANSAQSRKKRTGDTFARRIPDGNEIGASGKGTRAYPWDIEGLRINPHMFRHTFAAWRLRSGVGMEKIQAWLGHSTIALTVDIYGHVVPEDHIEDIGKAPRPRIAPVSKKTKLHP